VTKQEEKKRKRVGCVQPTSTLARHTGLSGGAPDNVRCARLAGGEPAALGKMQKRTAIIHRTVRWCTGLSGEPTVASSNGRLRNPWATRGLQQRSVGHTGQCPVRQLTPRTNGRLHQIGKEIAHRTAAPDCPVHHPTEGKFGLPSWPPTAPSCLGAIKGTPRRIEE
jgi:hypothetical protein